MNETGHQQGIQRAGENDLAMTSEHRQGIWPRNLVGTLAGCVVLAVAISGCAVKPVRTTERPTLPSAKSAIGQKLAAAMMPPEVASRAQGNAVAPGYTSTISLEWDNPNQDSAEWPLKYCLTEFHATSDPTKPFAFKAYAPPLTNRVTFAKTNAQEFYICRFVWTNVTPWCATGWNTK